MALPSAVSAAVAHGVLALDSAQRDYLSALLGQPLPEAPPPAHSGGGGGEFSQERIAAAAAKIGQVHDVLPGYGDGFLTAALLVRRATLDTNTLSTPLVACRGFRRALGRQTRRGGCFRVSWVRLSCLTGAHT